MKVISAALTIVFIARSTVNAFTVPSSGKTITANKITSKSTASPSPHSHSHSPSSLFPSPRSRSHEFESTSHSHSNSQLTASSSAIPAPSPSTENNNDDGGIFTFNTKYGRLNPYGIYYGTVAILLGLPWFVALTLIQIFYKLTNNRFDKNKRLPHFVSHLWGITLLFLTRCFPKIERKEVLRSFLSQKRAAMFVANHNSWMDIPFLGVATGIGNNYKFVSKAELQKVPILGKSIQIGGHVMVDRTSRRSQLMTLKSGIDWMKRGMHLVTFPEGTRSKTNRVLPFKNGAFKMAHKVGAPVVPISIIGSGDAHPSNWMFPRKPSHFCRVIFHDPVESNDKTEEELAEAVRQAIISDLPEKQRPLD